MGILPVEREGSGRSETNCGKEEGGGVRRGVERRRGEEVRWRRCDRAVVSHWGLEGQSLLPVLWLAECPPVVMGIEG